MNRTFTLAQPPNWGPFSPALSREEFVARLRSLEAAVIDLPQSVSPCLRMALQIAEARPAALLIAREAVIGLPAHVQRELFSRYSAAKGGRHG